jgi:hypothetical protein
LIEERTLGHKEAQQLTKKERRIPVCDGYRRAELMFPKCSKCGSDSNTLREARVLKITKNPETGQITFNWEPVLGRFCDTCWEAVQAGAQANASSLRSRHFLSSNVNSAWSPSRNSPRYAMITSPADVT